MSRRSYRELWEQLKVVILFSNRKRYSRKELHDIMVSMEIAQLAQDPTDSILKATTRVE